MRLIYNKYFAGVFFLHVYCTVERDREASTRAQLLGLGAVQIRSRTLIKEKMEFPTDVVAKSSKLNNELIADAGRGQGDHNSTEHFLIQWGIKHKLGAVRPDLHKGP
jgi:hypothetical protein